VLCTQKDSYSSVFQYPEKSSNFFKTNIQRAFLQITRVFGDIIFSLLNSLGMSGTNANALYDKKVFCKIIFYIKFVYLLYGFNIVFFNYFCDY